MSGSTENQASELSKISRRQRILNLTTALKMLPLVRSIVGDLLGAQQKIAKVRFELSRLDRQRHDLSWPERRRRYALQDEVSAIEKDIEHFTLELRELGLALIDAESGRVGFPTLVNNRPAFFAWQRGGTEIRYWHFADEVKDRPIPMAWFLGEGIVAAEVK